MKRLIRSLVCLLLFVGPALAAGTWLTTPDGLPIKQGNPLPTNDAGTAGAGISQPSGGVGLTGWLSGIYSAVTGTLSVSWSGQGVAATQSGLWTVQPGNTQNTTPWLTQDGADGSTGSSAPSKAMQAGALSSGNLTGIIQPDTSAAISISTATTTQLVALSSGKKIYITAWDVIAAGTGNFQLEYGTGTNCGTGTTPITGNYNLTAQQGIAKGGSIGVVFIVPAGNALCAVTSAAVGMYGSLSYTLF